uniref:Uncharacterized protein n=1 Tax=Steinernema glaseri TaxID=37863 RepID=A0A1I7ZB80_9BILA
MEVQLYLASLCELEFHLLIPERVFQFPLDDQGWPLRPQEQINLLSALLLTVTLLHRKLVDQNARMDVEKTRDLPSVGHRGDGQLAFEDDESFEAARVLGVVGGAVVAQPEAVDAVERPDEGEEVEGGGEFADEHAVEEADLLGVRVLGCVVQSEAGHGPLDLKEGEELYNHETS